MVHHYPACTIHVAPVPVKILKLNCISEKDLSLSEVTIKTINVLSSVQKSQARYSCKRFFRRRAGHVRSSLKRIVMI